MEIIPYLTFNGNCREGMKFYKDCLGGKLSFQTIGDSPFGMNLPVKMKNYILNATLTQGSFVLMGTDLVTDDGLKRGNSVSLILNCKSEEEIRKLYRSLAKGGTTKHPLEDTYWGAVFGGLIDKYGHHWILNYNKTD